MYGYRLGQPSYTLSYNDFRRGFMMDVNRQRHVMIEHKKRDNWLDVFQKYPLPPGISRSRARENALIIDNALHELWELGRNLIQLWAPDHHGMLLLVIPHYRLEEFAAQEHLVEAVLTMPKQATLEQLHDAARVFGTEVKRVTLPFTPGAGLDNDLISELLHRYSISLVKDRAVALFDIVGFSLLSPLEQVTQLNSLSYSINAAQHKLMERSINIHFARSSTGDGFYVWNRARGGGANIDLFDLLQLVLADNLIAQRKASGRTVPILKTCFNIGPNYEYYQAIGLDPSTFSYIVGNASIELARMIEPCQPHQILIRDFEVHMPAADGQHEEQRLDTMGFIKKVQRAEPQLRGVVLSGHKIESLHCYLTEEAPAGTDAIRKFRIADKHGLTRDAYNVRVDISLAGDAPISLGLAPAELVGFENLDAVQCRGEQHGGIEL